VSGAIALVVSTTDLGQPKVLMVLQVQYLLRRYHPSHQTTEFVRESRALQPLMVAADPELPSVQLLSHCCEIETGEQVEETPAAEQQESRPEVVP
jgi:hypothetical protein